MKLTARLFVAVLGALLAGGVPASADAPPRSADPLRKFNIDPEEVTVGGLSAGAFMAVQLHVAFSATFRGAAVFAGGPYYCAQGNLLSATSTCMTAQPTPPPVDALAVELNNAFVIGSIDDPRHLARARVYLYSGMEDSVVHPTVVRATEQLYRRLAPQANITAEYTILGEHAIPTDSFGNPCTVLDPPYIGRCHYDGAGAALQALYGSSLRPRAAAVPDNLMTFDQSAFGASALVSLRDQGFIYVPTACQQGARCRLHVSLHGCQQTVDDVQDTYVRHAGFNEWAESNGIIVVYPQAVRSYVAPFNPKGCFDWWGYTRPDYAVRSGPQMVFIKSIVSRLVGA